MVNMKAPMLKAAVVPLPLEVGSNVNVECPQGMHVLVVDDDPICLLILDRMLQRYCWKVTTCESAANALEILRANKDGFDMVISDLHLPDMDGFKLLGLVSMEMDLPVILMLTDGDTNMVMKGIELGACDYLLKPLRIEELKNIHQHVIRKRQKHMGPLEDKKGELICLADGVSFSGVSGTNGEGFPWRQKPRVVWTVELHQQFVNAVNRLGIKKAEPKNILKLMDVHGLTREDVASHLQKYRLYLDRINKGDDQTRACSVTFAACFAIFWHCWR